MTISPGTFAGFGTGDNVRAMNTTIGYTKVFSPTFVGEFRFGHQGTFQDSGSEDGLAGTDWLGIFGMPGMDFVRESASGPHQGERERSQEHCPARLEK